MKFPFKIISTSWDYWSFLFLIVSMVLLPFALFPFSRGRIIFVVVFLLVGHINTHRFGVRIGFMVTGLMIGTICRFL